MFGFGYLEIGIVLLLVIIVFGGKRTGRFLGQAFGIYKKVDDTRQELKKPFNITNYFGNGKK